MNIFNKARMSLTKRVLAYSAPLAKNKEIKKVIGDIEKASNAQKYRSQTIDNDESEFTTINFFAKEGDEDGKHLTHGEPRIDNSIYTFKEQKHEVNIFDFSDPKMMSLVNLETDKDIGGNSNVKAEYCFETNSLSLSGKIEADEENRLESDPYAECTITYDIPMNLSILNGISIEFYTSGTPFNILFGCSNITVGEHLYGVVAKTQPGWDSFDIPIHDLKPIWKVKDGYRDPTSGFFQEEYLSTRSISFRFESKEEASFHIKLKSVKAFFNPYITKVHKLVHRRNYFYLTPKSYKLMSFDDFDTGEAKYSSSI